MHGGDLFGTMRSVFFISEYDNAESFRRLRAHDLMWWFRRRFDEPVLVRLFGCGVKLCLIAVVACGALELWWFGFVARCFVVARLHYSIWFSPGWFI